MTTKQTSLLRYGLLAFGLALSWGCAGTVEQPGTEQQPPPAGQPPTGQPPSSQVQCPTGAPWGEPCAELGQVCGYEYSIPCEDGSESYAYFEYECVDGQWFEVFHADPYCPAPAECPAEWPFEGDSCPAAGMECWYDWEIDCGDGTSSEASFLYGCAVDGWFEIMHYDPAC